ncbi:LamG-like jellyroll fold domain-containing protein [Rhodopirellula baltica]|uniref:Protein containing FecR protein domain n=1 Tax=Rhodopirellula baltica WH47 TaxID=991778 RepID=F2AYJ1_RHOBT|nr:LamG-like jellyroll fold domain-containing protein [Rhodopirellula baltica]EGF25282.1 protein containing FecR protein domain [Rhodopirellula baltica WH47]
MMSIDDDFIDRVLEGLASDDEVAEFQVWLQVTENVERYAYRAELHSNLWRCLGRRDIQKSALELGMEHPASDFVPQEGLRSPIDRSRQLSMLTAVTLVTAACILIAFVLTGGKKEEGSTNDFVASVVRNVGGAVAKNGAPWNEPQIPVGAYVLQEGLLSLQFGGGVIVYIEAPAHFDAISTQRLVLHTGRLSARVPPEGIGFTVVTPEAEVVDFGTEFSIDVEDGSSEVHVFDGLVRVHPNKANQGDSTTSLDLKASQAVRISEGQSAPEDISIATDRFIRDFDEQARKYAPAIRKMSPLAFYRMPIRDKGLVSEPPKYSGVVLTGEGKRPPHARGVFVGGSLRVGVDSIGRGGRVNDPPALNTGQFSVTLFVYRESDDASATAVTNMHDDQGNFDVSLDDDGRLQATARCLDGSQSTVIGESVLPLRQWRHVVLTVDGLNMHFYEDGKLVGSKPCAELATSESDPIWFGTNASTTQAWDGRVDEVALFDRALDDEEVLTLYRLAQEEITRSR